MVSEIVNEEEEFVMPSVPPFHPPLYIQRAQYIQKLLKEHGVRSFIDAGCANGQMLAYLTTSQFEEFHFRRVRGIDMDSSCLNEAVGLLPDPTIRLAHYLHDVRVELVQGNLTTPYANINVVDRGSSEIEESENNYESKNNDYCSSDDNKCVKLEERSELNAVQFTINDTCDDDVSDKNDKECNGSDAEDDHDNYVKNTNYVERTVYEEEEERKLEEQHDKREEYDAIISIEVIEHIAPHLVSSFTDNIFINLAAAHKSRMIVMTTPNRDENWRADNSNNSSSAVNAEINGCSEETKHLNKTVKSNCENVLQEVEIPTEKSEKVRVTNELLSLRNGDRLESHTCNSQQLLEEERQEQQEQRLNNEKYKRLLRCKKDSELYSVQRSIYSFKYHLPHRRHDDHYFEFTAKQWREYCEYVAERYSFYITHYELFGLEDNFTQGAFFKTIFDNTHSSSSSSSLKQLQKEYTLFNFSPMSAKQLELSLLRFNSVNKENKMKREDKSVNNVKGKEQSEREYEELLQQWKAQRADRIASFPFERVFGMRPEEYAKEFRMELPENCNKEHDNMTRTSNNVHIEEKHIEVVANKENNVFDVKCKRDVFLENRMNECYSDHEKELENVNVITNESTSYTLFFATTFAGCALWDTTYNTLCHNFYRLQNSKAPFNTYNDRSSEPIYSLSDIMPMCYTTESECAGKEHHQHHHSNDEVSEQRMSQNAILPECNEQCQVWYELFASTLAALSHCLLELEHRFCEELQNSRQKWCSMLKNEFKFKQKCAKVEHDMYTCKESCSEYSYLNKLVRNAFSTLDECLLNKEPFLRNHFHHREQEKLQSKCSQFTKCGKRNENYDSLLDMLCQLEKELTEVQDNLSTSSVHNNKNSNNRNSSSKLSYSSASKERILTRNVEPTYSSKYNRAVRKLQEALKQMEVCTIKWLFILMLINELQKCVTNYYNATQQDICHTATLSHNEHRTFVKYEMKHKSNNSSENENHHTTPRNNSTRQTLCDHIGYNDDVTRCDAIKLPQQFWKLFFLVNMLDSFADYSFYNLNNLQLSLTLPTLIAQIQRTSLEFVQQKRCSKRRRMQNVNTQCDSSVKNFSKQTFDTSSKTHRSTNYSHATESQAMSGRNSNEQLYKMVNELYQLPLFAFRETSIVSDDFY